MERKHNEKNAKEEIKVYKASREIEKHEAFVEIISKAYNATESVCKSYPNYFIWYWKKVVPDILTGTRDVIIIMFNEEVAGVAIVKKKDDERKLCTVYVEPNYRDREITTKLLEEAFSFLGTTKPLISISEEKLDMFQGIIKKYNWKKTQVLPEGYYNENSREIVFNGFIKLNNT